MEVISIGGKAIKINGKLLTASALASPEKLPSAEYPVYVKSGILALANKVTAVRNSSSIVFVTFSDPPIMQQMKVLVGGLTSKSVIEMVVVH